ncbi:MAG: hypothetical protein V9H25_13200 [Candidatus Competibacter sp.]
MGASGHDTSAGSGGVVGDASPGAIAGDSFAGTGGAAGFGAAGDHGGGPGGFSKDLRQQAPRQGAAA